VSFTRAPVAAALVDMLTAATGGGVFIHERPPYTVNAPAVVVGRAVSVSYGAVAFGIDLATLPLGIVGGAEADDTVDDLKATVRKAIEADPTVGGSVQVAFCTEERNWRNVSSGGADLLTVDLIVEIHA
jgi:hypothetical protein